MESLESLSMVGQQIVDRLKTEEAFTYHPRSLYAGEVQSLRELGLIEIEQDAWGFLWIVRPEA